MKDLAKILSDLIGIPSLSGEEADIQTYVYEFMKNVDLNPLYQEGNVVVKIEGKKKSKAVIFNAHVDTVSVGDIKQWKTNPFEGVIKDGKMYGLGASDEKGSVASLMLLAAELKKEKPNCDVWLTFVVKEEIDGSGTRDFMNWFKNEGYLEKHERVSGVLTEPNLIKEIELGHKGNAFVKLITEGKSGHGSKPIEDEDHAAWKMFEALKKVKSLSLEWQEEFEDSILGKPSISVPTAIKSGDLEVVNKIGDKCEAVIDIRTTPKLHDQVLTLLEKTLKGLAKVELVAEPGLYAVTSKNEEIVKVVQKVLPKAKLTIADGANDMCFFSEHNIPAVVVGPGDKKVIHQANECVKLDKIDKSVRVYQKIINEYGKQDS